MGRYVDDPAEIPVALFGGQVLEYWEFHKIDEVGRAALDAFLALEPHDLKKAEPHIYAYYNDIREDIGAEEIDEEVPFISESSLIWPHVSAEAFKLIRPRPEDDNWYVVVRGTCDWEPEHGLELVWKNGAELVTVGPHGGGHATNVTAFDDPTLAKVVYHSLSGKWSTHR